MLAIESTYHRFPRRPAIALAALAATLACAAAAARSAQAASLLVTGAGFGHGVGMSQQGALGYAERGWSYQRILGHYYAGTSIGAAPANAQVRVLIGGKVHQVALESYVRGVVSSEMSSSWPLAALEAQAIASRTYALTAHAGGAKFDVYADARSQVYRGVAARTPQSDAAVAATAGQIVTYAGRPAITYFFASSGGQTEDVQNSFLGSQPQPWLRSVVDQYERGDLHTWKLALSFASAAARLHGLVRGRFEGIEVLRRGVSPRIVAANVLGSDGPTAVTGPMLAERLGLYSTWAYFSTSEGQSSAPEPDRSGSVRSSAPAPAIAAPSGEHAGGVAPTSPEAIAASSGPASGGVVGPAGA